MTHPNGRIKLVGVIPRCGFCFDNEAEEEVIYSGIAVSLCRRCLRVVRPPARARRSLRLGAEPATEEETVAFVEAQEYTRAQPTFRGRPQAPHEYVLIWKSTDPWMQLRVLAFIRANGERRRWGPKWHTYWTHGEWEYWAMPPTESILNRRRLDWPTTV